MACGLYKDRVLSTKAARTLEEHLDEILPMMKKYPAFQDRFEKLKTSDTTFANIDWFCGERRDAKLAGNRSTSILTSIRGRGQGSPAPKKLPPVQTTATEITTIPAGAS